MSRAAAVAAAIYLGLQVLESIDPLQALAVIGGAYGDYRMTALLPLALAPGDEVVRSLTVPVSAAAGAYQVTLAPAATPELVVAERVVRVHLPGFPGGAVP